jgi:serine/threonine-protein kinase
MSPKAPALHSSRSYTLYGVIAAGGMGSVHLGRWRTTGGFSRRVAIKRLHAPFAADPEIAATFAEEARLVARVSHANVAAMLDVVSELGELFLVMEYVHGESLARLLRNVRECGGTVPFPIVSSVLADVLHGLHAAHEATDERGIPLQIVHRDVSPQNVIVGVDGIARVVDFGIAKALTHPQLTRDGQLKGKMPYMAPEQLLRRAIDRRVDVYAAGVMLWEALAGRRLFQGSEEATLFSKIVEEPQSAPSSVEPRVPSALDDIVMRALERDPSRRFSSALEMARAIEAAGPVAPASAVAEWTTTTAREALAKRAALIAEMESNDGNSEVRAHPAVSAPAVPRDSAPLREAEPTLAGTSPAQKVRRGRLPPVVWASGLAIAMGGGIVGAMAVRFSASGTAAPAVGSAAIASTPPPPIEAPALPSGPPSADPVAPPASTASAAASTSPASPRASSPPSSGAFAPRWCKIFDPNKRIFVMKEMRVARCP